MSVNYIAIKHSYTENRSDNYKKANIAEYIKMLKENDNNESIFEIIDAYERSKMYFDIEGIPFDQPNYIHEIIDDIVKHCNETLNEKFTKEEAGIIITKNDSSQSHTGLSYHVIFSNIIIKPYEIKDFLSIYTARNGIGYTYIDNSVYSHQRLFRAWNQPGINKNGGNDLPLVPNDKHLFIYPGYTNDEIIKRSIITYYDINGKGIKQCKLNITRKEIKRCEKISSKKTRKCEYSNNFKTVGNKQIFIFNHPVDKDTVEALMEKPAPKTGKEEYDKAVVLLELIEETETNKKMISLLKEFKEYYVEHSSYDGYRLSIEQIASIEKIIEAKI